MPDIYNLQRIEPRNGRRRERANQVVVAQIQRSHAARRRRPRSIRRQQARGRPALHAPPQAHALRRVRMVERQPARRPAPSGACIGGAAAGGCKEVDESLLIVGDALRMRVRAARNDGKQPANMKAQLEEADRERGRDRARPTRAHCRIRFKCQCVKVFGRRGRRRP